MIDEDLHQRTCRNITFRENVSTHHSSREFFNHGCLCQPEATSSASRRHFLQKTDRRVLSGTSGHFPSSRRLITHNPWRRFISATLTGHIAAVAVFASVFLLHQSSAIQTETCTYDIDFTTNSAKITCKGAPASVSVYANTATVQADEMYSSDGDGGRGGRQGPNTGLQKHNPKPDVKKTSFPKGDSGKDKNNGRKDSSEKSGAPQNIRQPSGKPTMKTAGDGLDDKRDNEFNEKQAAIHSSAFSDVVMNATHKLKRAKRQLSTYSDSIKNLSAYLQEGDDNLRVDMERLRKTSNSAKELKEGISAALRNQFSYLRYSMTIRSHELERLVSSLGTLVDVTADGLQGALLAHKSVLEEVAHVNRTIRAVRRKMIKEMKRERRHKGKVKDADRPKDKCPKEISAVGAGTARQMEDLPVGAYMVESYKNGPYQPVWIMQGSGPNDQLQQYDADVDVGYQLVAKYYPLPYQCVGTGHAIFRRHMYCHIANSQKLAKYHLSQMDPISELKLPGTGLDDFPYRSGLNSSMDLAVDEMGLWVIYANRESGGKIVITKLNHRLMEMDRSWTTTFPKSHAGNAFMICGVLYVTDSHTDVPTHIRYIYDTETSTERRLDDGQLQFPNSALLGVQGEEPEQEVRRGTRHRANVSMLSYDFKQSKLFAWNDGRIERFPIYFKQEQ